MGRESLTGSLWLPSTAFVICQSFTLSLDVKKIDLWWFAVCLRYFLSSVITRAGSSRTLCRAISAICDFVCVCSHMCLCLFIAVAQHALTLRSKGQGRVVI